MSKYGVFLVSGRRTYQEGHAAVFAGHPLCRLVAVADERDVPGTRADLVSMCADVERRGRVGALCAQAGKHIYFDKPLAGSLADVGTIVTAVERSGVRTQMYSLIEAPWVRIA